MNTLNILNQQTNPPETMVVIREQKTRPIRFSKDIRIR